MSERADEYFHDLRSDFDTLTLYFYDRNTERLPAPASHDEFVVMLKVISRRIGSVSAEMAELYGKGEANSYYTKAGRLIAAAHQAGIEFSGIKYGPYAVCEDTERDLEYNTRMVGRTKAPQMRPVVLSAGEKPVGIIKTLGEQVCYGLTNDWKHGIVARSFSSLQRGAEPLQIHESRRPWRLDVEELEPWLPARLSTLIAPHGVRKRMTTHDSRNAAAATLTHREMVARAGALLAYAVPLRLDEALPVAEP